MSTDITMRLAATVADHRALVRLAALDSARPLAGDVLLAEVDGELWAAAPLDGGPAIADPFRPSAAVAALATARARQLGAPSAARFAGAFGRRRPATAGAQPIVATTAAR